MLEDREILNIVANELSQSSGGNDNDVIDANRQQALAYYLGQPDGREIEGRSSVTSTDVADVVEWVLPEVVKSLTRSNDMVRFNAQGEDDEDQTQLETEWVYDCIMGQNEGFTIITTLVKDALIQKNCMYKTFFDEDVHIDTTEYENLTIEEYSYLMTDQDIEVVKETIDQDPMTGQDLFTVKLAKRTVKKKVKIEPIIPEEFRINRQHRSINPKTAPFVAQVTLKTTSELIEEGFDPDVISKLPRGQLSNYNRDYRWTMQGETFYPNMRDTYDESQEFIEVAECYIDIDVDEDGIAEFMQITVAGGDNPDTILSKTKMDKIEHPIGAGTGILMPHKFFGLSIFDRIKEIQDQKTALWRNTLDNVYLQNNKKITAVTGQVDLDTLLVSAPHQIIMQDAPGMVDTLDVQPIGQDAYQMMEYLDVIRAGRCGVAPEENVADQFIGLNGGDASIERIMTAREELVGMITRTFAETVLKPMMNDVRNIARRNFDELQDFKFKGKWVQINPSEWPDRDSLTVDVGTGSGNTKEQQQAMMLILQLQEKILANPAQSLVDEERVYNAIETISKMSGLKGINKYFVNPKSEEGQQKSQQTQESMQQQQQEEKQKEMIMLETQVKIAQVEEQKVRVQAENNQLKGQLENYKNQLKDAENRATAADKDANVKLGYAQLDVEREKLARAEAMKLTELEATNSLELSKMHQENKQETAVNE